MKEVVRVQVAQRHGNLICSLRFAALSALLLAASCSGGGSSAPSATGSDSSAIAALGVPAQRGALALAQTRKPPLVPPAGSIYLGAFVNYLKMLPPYQQQTADFEQEIGRKIAIHAAYYKWAQSGFPGAPEEDDFSKNRVSVVSWDCGATASNVISGKEDAIITARAQAFKTYKHLIFLRYFWEMNLPYAEENRPNCVDPNRDTNGLFNPTDYIAAWQHIHAIFVAQGATNVIWLWCPSGNVMVDPIQYYPGVAYTDWIGFDHYDVTGNVGLQNTLALPYQTLSPLNQPMMVGETGTLAASQSTYLTNAASVLQTNFPQILGFMYYDSYGHRQDWRLLSAGITAYATAGASPYLSAFAPKK